MAKTHKQHPAQGFNSREALATIERLAPIVTAQGAERAEAARELWAAKVRLLEHVFQFLRPAIHELGSRPLIKLCHQSGTPALVERLDERTLKIAGDHEPSLHWLHGDAGTTMSAIHLRETGDCYRLVYARSRRSSGSFRERTALAWEAGVTSVSAEDVLAEYQIEALLLYISAALESAASGHSEARSAQMRQRGMRINALATLIGGL